MNNDNNDNNKHMILNKFDFHDIENQTAIMGKEYFNNKKIIHNDPDLDPDLDPDQDIDIDIEIDNKNVILNDSNSPLEKFKTSNILFNSDYYFKNNIRKSQSYPNNYILVNKHYFKKKNNSNNIELIETTINPLINFNYQNEPDNTTSDLSQDNKISTKNNIFNKFISIFLHIFIMIVFEIYFYFNYVINIEKVQFLDKIQQYINEFEHNLNLDQTQKELIKNSFGSKYNNTFLTQLYTLYTESLKQQKKLLHHLISKSCKMAGIIGIIIIGLIGFCLWKKHKIKLNWIFIENILMFVLLGIFEYWFFMNIILNYNPITNAEIKYYVANQFVNYLNSTK